ncbi:hypothetical protein M472_16165 [Sphingobacterium paucimobilis HER1398]|uniref:Uncharacterized protein n=1 Tax=Sphingobacterium paucimobilis HER1398 TaxID=1346330 RepID=U2J5S1_9SPHI|nr:hypothetical protein M472_03595 [Sphingobacterium paucimobilis HER1398]ERJ60294.1 hypothetical protein M472_16165 [Sphingobacterium paucimobilis HER1398]
MLHYVQQIPVLAWDWSVRDLGTALNTMTLLEQQIRYSLDFWFLFIKKNCAAISGGNEHAPRRQRGA